MTQKTTFDEAMKRLQASPEEAEALEQEAYREAAAIVEKDRPQKPPSEDDGVDPDALPDWVVLPDDLKIPPHRQVSFMLFPANMTERPELGDRHVVCWSLTDGDEKFAYARCRGDAMRSMAELSKQQVRAIDGKKVDWSKGALMVDKFFTEIGPKMRQQLQNLYIKTHAMTGQEVADFFRSCVVVRTSTPG